MPRTKSALRQMRKSEKRRLRNRAARSTLRTAIKKVKAGIEERDVQRAELALLQAIPIIDKAAAKGTIHKNTAARYKSRLSHQLHTLKAAPAV